MDPFLLEVARKLDDYQGRDEIMHVMDKLEYMFDALEGAGICRFPPPKVTRPLGSSARVPNNAGTEHQKISADLGDLTPVSIEQVCSPVWRTVFSM